MMHTPSDLFIEKYNRARPQLVWTTFVSDVLTPISASQSLMKGDDPFFLLESVSGGTHRERYSVIGLAPDLVWKMDNEFAYISENDGDFIKQEEAPLDSFRKLHKEMQCDIPEELPPMASGLIGYMSYDAIRFIEPSIPDQNPDLCDIPVGLFMRPTAMVIFDSVTDTVYVITTVYPTQTISAEHAYNKALKRIEKVKETCLKGHPKSPKQGHDFSPDFKPSMEKNSFKRVIEKCKDYIRAGDIFQVVPSLRFHSKFKGSAFSFYRSLRHLNPSPFLFYLNFGGFKLVGSSPEIMVRLRDNKVTIRPLAGTRPRGKTAQEDAALSKELLADSKEMSEHLMLVDLSRHDVGSVAKPGSVKVTESHTVEYFSHVMHVASNVEGDLDPKFDALDALFSALPVGTVSGAPKIRAMQIIDEVENVKRGFYAGCVGYFSADGNLDTCISLRTALIKDDTITLQAGCGVVAESDPEAEYQEVLNKAKALMKAAENASQFT